LVQQLSTQPSATEEPQVSEISENTASTTLENKEITESKTQQPTEEVAQQLETKTQQQQKITTVKSEELTATPTTKQSPEELLLRDADYTLLDQVNAITPNKEIDYYADYNTFSFGARIPAVIFPNINLLKNSDIQSPSQTNIETEIRQRKVRKVKNSDFRRRSDLPALRSIVPATRSKEPTSRLTVPSPRLLDQEPAVRSLEPVHRGTVLRFVSRGNSYIPEYVPAN